LNRLIILGKNGQLGRAFLQYVREKGHSADAFDEHEVDFLRPQTMQFSLAQARVVINCAAYTNVDAAEIDEETATAINATAVDTLSRRCRAAGVPLIHFSTDYVFDGEATVPYPVEHPRAPMNAYGRSKAKGEELLLASGADHLLIRTSWVYAPWGENFVRTMARHLTQKERVKVVSDQRGRPTHVDTLVTRTLALFEQGQRGIFHVTDSGACSPYQFALTIQAALGTSCQVEPCSSAELPRPAPRPGYSVLDTSKADAILGEAPHYEERLTTMAAKL